MTDYANELRRYAKKLDGAPCTGDTRAVMRLAAANIEDLERRLLAAEIRLHAAAAHIEALERKLAEIKRSTYVAVTCNHVARMERAEARVAELEAERAKLEKQEPVGHIIFPKHRKAPDVRWADNTQIMEGAAVYAAPPVTAQAEGYVTAPAEASTHEK